MTWDEVIPDNSDADACWTDILLRASIHDSILRPVDGLAAEVGGHVRNEDLVLRDLVVWELVELKALDRLVVAVVEELGILADLPLVWLVYSGVPCAFVVGDLIGGAVLGCFLDGSLGPCSCCQVVGTLRAVIAEKVVAYGAELHRCPTLEEEDGEVIWD